jgi:choline-sulfatase
MRRAVWAGLLAAGCAQAPPSVLLITLDTTRADHLGPYGYPQAETPTYDRLAAEGTIWTRAYATCPLTIPSHSSIMTGRYPPTHGVRDNGDFILGPEELTLAERLSAAGYGTAAVTSAFPTRRRWGFGQGFEAYHDPLERLPTVLDWRDERPAEVVVDDALGELARRAGDARPLFLWVHLFDAHYPYAPPEPWASRHPGRPYDGEIAYADAQVGRLLGAWDAQHPRSLVVITADHGEAFGEGGEQTHGFLLHDGTLRVPLIVRARGLDLGLPIGSVVDDVVSHVDIVPSLLAWAGLGGGPELQGRPLQAGGSGAAWSEARTGLYSLGLAPLAARTLAEGRETLGVRLSRYPFTGGRVGVEEEAAVPAGESAAAAAAIGNWEAELIAASAGAEAGTATLRGDEVEALAALGYLGGDVHAEAGDLDPRDVIELIPLTWGVGQALARGQVREARALLQQLDAGMAGTAGAAELDARVLLAEGDLPGALNASLALYDRAPSSGRALRVAELLGALGAHAEAEGWFGAALDADPMSAAAMAGQVSSLLAMGALDEAEQAADEALAKVPDHAEVALLSAELLLARGELRRAEAEAAYAVTRMPSHPRARLVVAAVDWAQGEPERAIDGMFEALWLAPTDLVLRAQLCLALLDVGRAAEAQRVIRPAAELLPEDDVLRSLLDEATAAVEAQRRPPPPAP